MKFLTISDFYRTAIIRKSHTLAKKTGQTRNAVNDVSTTVNLTSKKTVNDNYKFREKIFHLNNNCNAATRNAICPVFSPWSKEKVSTKIGKG